MHANQKSDRVIKIAALLSRCQSSVNSWTVTRRRRSADGVTGMTVGQTVSDEERIYSEFRGLKPGRIDAY